MGITGNVKQEIIADIFGRQNGDVHESGICDANSLEEFETQMVILETKWSSSHASGNKFYKWFQTNKGKKFANHVITPVCQRAVLGFPPAKFTTNRSERTNGVIQDYVKRKCGRRLVDVFTFAVTLKELVITKKKKLSWLY